MTMHEALTFIDALHGYVERTVANRGPWCWPTRELLAYNLRLNREAFPRDRPEVLWRTFRSHCERAKVRGWLTEGPCTPHCHAVHTVLTGKGREALRLMGETGCGPQCVQHREIKLHLERKVA